MTKAHLDVTRGRLGWLLRLPDPGPMEPLSSDQLTRIRTELSTFLGVAVPSEYLNDSHLDKTYRELVGMAEQLRRGLPIVISSYRMQVTNTGEWLVAERFDRKRHEFVVLETLRSAAGLLRRCRGCPMLFIRTKRQAYCSPQCAVRERVRRFRARAASVRLKD